LAIIRSTTEKILNQTVNSLNASTIDSLKSIYSSVNKLHQVQKSLMLLSKIDNLEYNRNINVNFKEVTEQVFEKYREAFELREIHVSSNLADCPLSVDLGLAEILANNLFKNALKHNIANGYVSVTLKAKTFTIENSGLPFTGDPEQFFQRFTKGEKGNYGIGLSIVKQICELYNYSISYTIADTSKHSITITFP
jgi:signal transduction histidine kinase